MLPCTASSWSRLRRVGKRFCTSHKGEAIRTIPAARADARLHLHDYIDAFLPISGGAAGLMQAQAVALPEGMKGFG